MSASIPRDVVSPGGGASRGTRTTRDFEWTASVAPVGSIARPKSASSGFAGRMRSETPSSSAKIWIAFSPPSTYAAHHVWSGLIAIAVAPPKPRIGLEMKPPVSMDQSFVCVRSPSVRLMSDLWLSPRYERRHSPSKPTETMRVSLAARYRTAPLWSVGDAGVKPPPCIWSIETPGIVPSYRPISSFLTKVSSMKGSSHASYENCEPIVRRSWPVRLP